MKKKILVLGSTGTIGVSTLNIIKKDKKNFAVKLLSTNTNIKKVVNQARIFKVKNVIIINKNSFKKALSIYKKENIKFHNSFSIIDKLFKKKEIYYGMISVVGLDGLDPSLRVIKYCQNVAIINKESLICGWNLIFRELKKHKTNFFPVDSEHFSIFSLLNNNKTNDIEEVYITASGGPFLNYSKSKLSKIKINDALNHPSWKMGKKISIDSSTMMNKVFEVIEAKKIFNLKYSQIKIIIHPKSYIHAIIKFKNGFFKILFHEADMKIPIHNSIYFNQNKQFITKKINFKILNNLKFQKINFGTFPLIKLLKKIPKSDSLFETVLISINDFFVSLYLEKKINYLQLIKLINYYSSKKIFYHLKRLKAKKVDDIIKTRYYVYEKLRNYSINTFK